MKLSTKELAKVFRRFERLIPELSSSSEYIVTRAVTKRELDDIISLDEHEGQGGFLPPNKLKSSELTSLWKRDRHGFYAVYTRDKKPVGYCDIFGLDAQYKFISSQLLSQPPGKLDLPKIDELCDAILPRTKWSDKPIEIYIDAILVLEPKKHREAAWHLLRHICADMQRFPYVYTSKIATVVVENELNSQFSSSTADDPVRNTCHGAKMAIRSGLSWGRYKGIGFEEAMGLGRYLYVSELGLPCAVKDWMICSVSSLLKRIAIDLPDLLKRAKQIEELFSYLQTHL